jgi:hypothetical protein
MVRTTSSVKGELGARGTNLASPRQITRTRRFYMSGNISIIYMTGSFVAGEWLGRQNCRRLFLLLATEAIPGFF